MAEFPDPPERIADATRAFDPTSFVKNLTERPGVYRMLDAAGTILYVGKARNLKRRVSSYFHKRHDAPKTRALMRQVAAVETTVTNTEAEALILEDTLIKTHLPRYNVLLRDDKSYPYIRVSVDHEFPRVSFYRGSTRRKGRYFGPFPSAHAVRDTVNLLQKLFRLRSCEDGFFARRNRPCLQYQIKRCTAPCVGLIDRDDYAADLNNAMRFLEGKSHEIGADLAARMEEASKAQDYEAAATFRDQIARLKRIQVKQHVADARLKDFDIVAGASDGALHCVAVIYVRGGRNIGGRSYFPKALGSTDPDELLGAFIAQYYLARGAPQEILVSRKLADAAVLSAALTQKAGHKVRVTANPRGERAAWLDMARTNAEHALTLRKNSNVTLLAQMEDLQRVLGLGDLPERIECFDISHTRGESTTASCVVFTRDGLRKSDYRRFNIEDVTPGDDYAAMAQVLRRRYTRVKRGESPLPDLIVVDGGRGQLAQAAGVMDELQLGDVALLGIAKGPERRAGHEQLFLFGEKQPFILRSDSPALRLLMHIRDEAHRFAIAGHRQRRARRQTTSVLEEIAGLGPKRRRELLRHFGGLQGVRAAAAEDLAAVSGIGPKLARTIYDHFH